MGTRAVYTFKDNLDTYHVYKHWDGYPTADGALGFIENAKNLAWDLPRFEANEFAAAFISANKDVPGDVYLTKHFNRHGDLSYRYVITSKGTQLIVEVYEAVDWDLNNRQKFKLIKTEVI